MPVSLITERDTERERERFVFTIQSHGCCLPVDFNMGFVCTARHEKWMAMQLRVLPSLAPVWTISLGRSEEAEQVAAMQVPSGSRLEYPWVPTLESTIATPGEILLSLTHQVTPR